MHPPEIAALRADLRRFLPGVLIGEVLGSGASAHMVAVDTAHSRWVAKIGKSAASLDALLHEQLALRAIRVPSIPLAVGTMLFMHDRRPVLVMTRCPGHVVSTMHVGARAASLLTSNLLTVLRSVHRRGWVHHDVKPGNVLFETHDGRVSLIDFGEASPVGEPRRTDRMVGGTPEYMSPEQLGGEPTGPEADVYAAGALLYELLCGRRPFVRHSMRDLFIAKSTGTFDLVSSHEGVPVSAMDELTRRMMSADPSARPSVAECLESLDEFQARGMDWTITAKHQGDASSTWKRAD